MVLDLQQRIGQRIRHRRTELGLTLQQLAEQAGLSARFLSEVEAGRSNISVVRLAGVAAAVGESVDSLVRAPAEGARAAIDQLLDGCDDEQLTVARRVLELTLGQRTPGIVALLGVRGAGKSTVGPLLAQALGVSFVELDEHIEARAGMPIGDIFTLHGQDYYRRAELACLEDLVRSGDRCVVALPGGIVQIPSAVELIEASCTSVWLRATAVDHWSRVFAQGDTRPMEGREDAMADLRALMARREPLYARADLIADTSSSPPSEVTASLVATLDARGLRP